MYKLLIGLMLITALMIAVSICLYINQFGVGVWENHEDWARMGSFFGGIFGPILASLSLLFLAYEYHLGKKHKLVAVFENDVMAFLPKLSARLLDTSFKSDMEEIIISYKRLIYKNKEREAKILISTYIAENIRFHTLWFQIDASMRHIRKSSKFRHERMRAYILSECEIADLVLLDEVRLASAPNASKEGCLFLYD